MTVVSGADSLKDGTTEFSLPAGQKWIARHQPQGFVDHEQFVDEAANTPIKQLTKWRHEHRFEEVGGTTRITDTVHTTAPEKVLSPAFAYRQHQLAEDIAFLKRMNQLGTTDYDDQPRTLTVAMTGSRGLVGTALSAQLSTAGHKVIQLVRGTPRHNGAHEQRHWDTEDPDATLFDGVDAVVHLAGESIMAGSPMSTRQTSTPRALAPRAGSHVWPLNPACGHSSAPPRSAFTARTPVAVSTPNPIHAVTDFWPMSWTNGNAPPSTRRTQASEP